jgi:hypothetical protein
VEVKWSSKVITEDSLPVEVLKAGGGDQIDPGIT